MKPLSRWMKISLIVVGGGIIIGYLVVRQIDKGFQQLNESKASRRTTATVISKEYVKYDDKNHSYIGDLGDPIEVAPGREEFRVYYEIDNFDQVPEPRRSRLLKSEQERIKKFGYRFDILTKDQKQEYDQINPGDKLEVFYRYITDEKEIISIDYPAQAKK